MYRINAGIDPALSRSSRGDDITLVGLSTDKPMAHKEDYGRFGFAPPSCIHEDRSNNNPKSEFLKRMYREEAVHFGIPNPEYISPTKEGKISLNPINMTRMVIRSVVEFVWFWRI
jgi:hypothetical protein